MKQNNLNLKKIKIKSFERIFFYFLKLFLKNLRSGSGQKSSGAQHWMGGSGAIKHELVLPV